MRALCVTGVCCETGVGCKEYINSITLKNHQIFSFVAFIKAVLSKDTTSNILSILEMKRIQNKKKTGLSPTFPKISNFQAITRH